MKMYHGTLFYAVRSRDVGTFGGKAPRATIKIYRSGNCASPAVILDQPGQMSEFAGLIRDAGEDRAARDKIMAEFVHFGG